VRYVVFARQMRASGKTNTSLHHHLDVCRIPHTLPVIPQGRGHLAATARQPDSASRSISPSLGCAATLPRDVERSLQLHHYSRPLRLYCCPSQYPSVWRKQCFGLPTQDEMGCHRYLSAGNCFVYCLEAMVYTWPGTLLES
jgi:hypothetical protein